jgi:Tol biopolymer transport system component
MQLWVAPVSEGRRSGEPRRIGAMSGSAYSPSWSPDGRRIAFLLDAGKGGGVWIAEVSGKTPPRSLVEGVDPAVLEWNKLTGKLLVSGFFGQQARGVWEVPLDGSLPKSFAQATTSGSDKEILSFDLSPDGKLLALQEWDTRGDIWVLESQKGSF